MDDQKEPNMGLRFRRSIKIAPGVRLNLSARGGSLTVGPRGASVNVSSRGIYGNAGIPGTGLSYRGRLGALAGGVGSASSPGEAATQPQSLGVRLSLEDDGSVQITDASGAPLPQRLVRMLREQKAQDIDAWLTDRCEYWNRGIERILNLHLDTPAPDKRRLFHPVLFAERAPERPREEKPGVFARLLRSRRERIERENQRRTVAWRTEVDAWEARRALHAQIETARQSRFEGALRGDADAMQAYLEEVLLELDWPRETNISFEFAAGGLGVLLDVDLPEIEDMPRQHATVAARGLKINVKDRSETQVRREYMAHVHAIGFRLAGEVFSALPTVLGVMISGYSQRADRAFGRVSDEYLYSARISRQIWEQFDFSHLPAIDLPTAFEKFELRRSMTRTGIFQPISPFAR
jgi:hypothetical protein